MEYMKTGGCNEASAYMNSFSYDSMQGFPLAMAYVPWQQWKNVCDGTKGIQQGTIFKDLVFPFLAASPVCRSCEQNSGMQRRTGTMERGMKS